MRSEIAHAVYHPKSGGNAEITRDSVLRVSKNPLYIISFILCLQEYSKYIYTLSIICPYGNATYRFELTVKPEEKDYLERNPILKEHADVVEKILKGAE